MEIHKPKAAHSWREFLTEIGTIICGILIALELEQSIEWLHWRERVENAEVRLNGEVTTIYVNAVEWQMLSPCFERRLADLNAALLQNASTWTPLPPIHSVIIGDVPFTATFRFWPDEIWNSYVADGTAPHLSRARYDFYAVVYHHARDAREGSLRTFLTSSALDPLETRQVYSASFREAALVRVAELRRLTANVKLAADQTAHKIETFKATDRGVAERWVRNNATVYKACFDRGLLQGSAPPGPNPGTLVSLPTSGILKDRD